MEPARVLLADPPWRFGDKLPGKKRGAAKHYATLSVEEIKAFPLPPLADDALLFLWRVAAMVPEAYEVARAWGFEAKSEIVWVKMTTDWLVHFGMGRYVRNSHEVCIVARRGKSIIRDHSVKSVLEARVGEHSAKPEAFYHLVEKLAPGPYCELFARKERRGWTSFGDELPDGPDSPPPAFDSAKPWPPPGWLKVDDAIAASRKGVNQAAKHARRAKRALVEGR